MNSVWWVSLAALELVQREQAGEQLTAKEHASIVDFHVVLIMLLHLQPSIPSTFVLLAVKTQFISCVSLSEKLSQVISSVTHCAIMV